MVLLAPLVWLPRKFIILARMGLSFWRTEEEWAMAWFGQDTPDYINNKTFEERVMVIINCCQHRNLTDPPSSKTAVEGSSRIAPTKKTGIPTTEIIIREPFIQGKAPLLKKQLRPQFPLPQLRTQFHLSNLSSLSQHRPANKLSLQSNNRQPYYEFVGDGQFTSLDLNVELLMNEEILGELPLTNEAVATSSLT